MLIKPISCDELSQLLIEHKAEEVKVYPGHLSDWVIVAAGTSTRHVKALAEQIVQVVKEEGVTYSLEGLAEGNWVLIDLNYIIVHIFLTEIRDYYAIDELLDQTAQLRPSS